jgi:hypothetical protein
VPGPRLAPPRKSGLQCPIPANSILSGLEPWIWARVESRWAGGLTWRADIGLPHVPAYGKTDKNAARERGLSLGSPTPLLPFAAVCVVSNPSPPVAPVLPQSTSRDLADPVQLRLALHDHPLQRGQVQHCTAPDVIVVMPAPVEIVVRELEKGWKRKE